MMNKIFVMICLLAMVAGSDWVWTGTEWEWQEKKDTDSVGDLSNTYGKKFGPGKGGGQSFVDSDVIEGSGGSDYDDGYDDEDYDDNYNYDDEIESKTIKTTPSPKIIPSGNNPWSSDDEDFVEGSGDSEDQIIVKEKEPVTDDDKESDIFDNKKDSDIYDDKDSDIYDDKDSDIYVESTYQPNGNNNWNIEKEHKEPDQDVYVESTNSEDDITDDDDYEEIPTDNKGVYNEVTIKPVVPDSNADDIDDDTVDDYEVVHTDNKGVYNEVPIKPVVPDIPQSTPPPSSPDVHKKGPTTIHHPASFFAQPGILAAVIGGAVVGLLCAILLVMFIVYRMRKKDEGSYALDEPKRSHNSNSYSKPPSREFYA